MSKTRQIHLDFHCSEKINHIGKDFDKKKFQNTLKLAKVNSVNLFAKCHHSWSYYPTKVGSMHPNLEFDLLGLQIEACAEVGIATNIYYAVGWSSNDAEANPDWCSRNRNGSFIINGAKTEINDNFKHKLPNFYWKFMCLNNSYHDMIYQQVNELCERYDVDGFWFDIYQAQRYCYCKNCRNSMLLQGINIDDQNKVETFNATNIKRHCESIRALIRKNLPNANVFFNGTNSLETGVNFHNSMYEFNSIQDLEDLPTTWGGYDKLPMQSKLFINLGYEITAMSGKFHTEWGEFGGFKHQEALKYEAASMIAWGANCNFGDQLHPYGHIDLSTYENIGYAYDYVEKIEEYGIRGKPISPLGVWRSFDEEADEGISRILLENHEDFNIANFSPDFKEYSVIIFPSKTKLTSDEISKVADYIYNGGCVIALEKSVLNFLRHSIPNHFGIEYIGESKFDCDYTMIDKEINSTFVKTQFLNYIPAIKVKKTSAVEVLAEIYEPLFNRTIDHYCSHQKTPFKNEIADHPAATKKGRCIFIAHHLDSN